MIYKLPVGLPDLPFLRHNSKVRGCAPGLPFGEKYLYKWWEKACSNPGSEGADLYGGTRQSSATALKEFLSPEQIKAWTMYSTNKALERYFAMLSKTDRREYLNSDFPTIGLKSFGTRSLKM